MLVDREPGSVDSLCGRFACRLTVDEWESLAETLLLTPRELDIVQCLLLGKSEIGVGRDLGISTNTVHTHLGRIYKKLEVRSIAGLILRIFTTYVKHVRLAAEDARASSPLGAGQPAACRLDRLI
ncbi:MAG: LuxR C-terminal-related transcriptional regulator [Phycisphaerales bacterium]|nr:LuxR C-terminal-related transcriptional regulator [Phycisphaerales bacterium]